MKFKHLMVSAVMTSFSLLALAAPEAATPQAGSGAAAATAATPKSDAKPAKKAKASEKGKTRGLKSKKGKEYSDSSSGDTSNPPPDPPKPNWRSGLARADLGHAAISPYSQRRLSATANATCRPEPDILPADAS